MPESSILHTHIETGQRKPFAPRGTVVRGSSSRQGWRGFVFEHHRLPAMETPEFLVTKQIIALQISPPMQVEWKRRGQYTGRQIVPNDVSLTPAFTRDALRWHKSETEFLVCELDPAFLAQSVRDTTISGSSELRQVRGIQDPRIAAVLFGLKADMDAGYSSGPLYGETLATALAVYLTQTYATSPHAPHRPLPLARSEIRRALEYIHDNLETDLTLHHIAGAAGMSPSHFARLFRDATGQSLHRYVLTARVERAQSLLRQSETSLAAISLHVGFYDESHLIRHFKRIVGIAPGEWRKK